MKTRIVKVTENKWIPQYIPQFRLLFIWFNFKKELYPTIPGHTVTVKFNSMREAIDFIASREDKLPKDGQKTYYYKDGVGNYKPRGQPVNHSTPPENI